MHPFIVLCTKPRLEVREPGLWGGICGVDTRTVGRAEGSVRSSGQDGSQVRLNESHVSTCLHQIFDYSWHGLSLCVVDYCEKLVLQKNPV